MNNLNLNMRFLKIATGSTLIGFTLMSGYGYGEVNPILCLIAIPVIISGIADWRPLEWCATKLADIAKSLMERIGITSHGA